MEYNFKKLNEKLVFNESIANQNNVILFNLLVDVMTSNNFHTNSGRVRLFRLVSLKYRFSNCVPRPSSTSFCNFRSVFWFRLAINCASHIFLRKKTFVFFVNRFKTKFLCFLACNRVLQFTSLTVFESLLVQTLLMVKYFYFHHIARSWRSFIVSHNYGTSHGSIG